MSYYQAAIFRFLQASPGAKAPAIAEAVGSHTRAVTQALQKLKRAGKIRQSGGALRKGWEVVPFEICPRDRRGGDMKLRARSAPECGSKSKKIRRPVPVTALEQAWGWAPRTFAIDAENNEFDNLRGTVRPENTEAA